MSEPSAPRSSVVIAKLLHSEGYTDFVANMVKRYWRRNLVDPNRLGRLASIERAFREQVIPKLTDGDKKVLGRFMSVNSRMQFDAGLRIGLMSAMQGQEKDDADHAVRVQLHVLQEEIVRLKDVLAKQGKSQ